MLASIQSGSEENKEEEIVILSYVILQKTWSSPK